VLFAFGILVVFSINGLYRGCERYQYYSGILGSILASVFAAFLVWVAWEQLGNLGKTSSADFLHKIDNDFFTGQTRRLFSLIECGALEFRPNNEVESPDDAESQPYFEVNQDKLDKTKLPGDLKRHLGKRLYYSAWEIDDFLLGHLENLGMLEQRGVVDFQSVYDEFSWYIQTVWNDEHIKEYIRYIRAEDKTDRIDVAGFNQFQYIAIKCLEYENLHGGPCMWWWKFKRHFCWPKIDIKIPK
jgi:hypothetical protein